MMPCPTCDHTMQLIAKSDEELFWCSRCGTIKDDVASEEPKLVSRACDLWETVCRSTDKSVRLAAKNVRECVSNALIDGDDS